MNREDIIRMARDAGFEQLDQDAEDWVCFSEEIERFAALVAAAKETELMDSMTIAYMSGYQKGKDAGAAAEREACALECEDGASTPEELLCAKLIRARGQK